MINNKQLIGLALVAVGFGVLSYLYTGYFKPKSDVQKEFENTKK